MLWLLIANLLLVTVALTHIVDIDRQLRKRIAMSAQETVNAVVAQLGKAKAELLEKIADLQLQLDDAKVADVVDLSELVAVAQALDDIVPDVPEEPAEEPVEDPVVVELICYCHTCLKPVGDVAEDAAGDAPPF